MFWSREKFIARGLKENIVDNFSSDHVSHGAYELALGAEAFLTSTPDSAKTLIAENGNIVIPPGQFAILLTEEAVRIPTNAMGFISIRFSIKRRGLINVSGFHVDPGYSYRLKFAVYNAGSHAITLERGRRIFMLWLSDIDCSTQFPYVGKASENNTITPDDQDDLRGNVSSPAQLREEVDKLRKEDFAEVKNKVNELSVKFESQRGYYGIYVALLGAILLRLLFVPWTLFWSPIVSQERLDELKQQLKKELAVEAAAAAVATTPSARPNQIDSTPPALSAPVASDAPDDVEPVLEPSTASGTVSASQVEPSAEPEPPQSSPQPSNPTRAPTEGTP